MIVCCISFPTEGSGPRLWLCILLFCRDILNIHEGNEGYIYMNDILCIHYNYTIIITELLIFHTVMKLWNSGKTVKSGEIHKTTQNTTKFSRNLIKYMSVQLIRNLPQLLGLFTCCKLTRVIYLKTSSLKCANNVPKLPGVDYVAKNWALAMMLKALLLVHFWSIIVVERTNDDLC